MIHTLKTLPALFADVRSGKMKFQFRKNDRNFQAGDTLVLREYDPQTETFSGEDCMGRVSYLAADIPGLPEGYCILGIEPLPEAAEAEASCYIVLDLFNPEIVNVECAEDGKTIFCDTLAEAETLAENCQHPLIVPIP